LWDATANLSGSLFDLPAGPLGVAIGYEHRDQKGSFTPDPVVAAGNGSDIAALPTAGGFNADEVYGEFSIPLLKDLPFVRKLDGSFAVRYSNYSTSGSQTTLKGGLNWKPTDDLLLRGTYAEGYRAPSIGELYGSASRADTVVDDPCSSDSSSAQNIRNNTTIATNCRAQGVPVGYVQSGAQKGVVTGGNAALKAETSRSFVGGGVYSPRWTSGFARTLSLEINYFNIKVNNAIRAIGADTLVDRCVGQNDALSCAAVTRSATGNIVQIEGLLQNIGSIKTDGLDANFTYRSHEGPYGSVGLYWANTFLFSWTEVVPATDGFTSIKRVGTEAGSANDQTYPRYRSTATLDWSLGGFKASLTGRYISAVHEAQDGDNHLMQRRLYGDIQLSWDTKLNERDFNFAVGVNNLSGISPPPCRTCSLNGADPTTYDVPGQFFYARVGVKM
jgi:iron complex outermembrane receptor protein